VRAEQGFAPGLDGIGVVIEVRDDVAGEAVGGLGAQRPSGSRMDAGRYSLPAGSRRLGASGHRSITSRLDGFSV
jgi:hypothetical protein